MPLPGPAPGFAAVTGQALTSHAGHLYAAASGVGFSDGPPLARYDGTDWEFFDAGLFYLETVYALESVDLGAGTGALHLR